MQLSSEKIKSLKQKYAKFCRQCQAQQKALTKSSDDKLDLVVFFISQVLCITFHTNRDR